MRGNSLHGNREIPSALLVDGGKGRPEKAESRTSDMNAGGKSDGPIVPERLPNKDGADSSAEAVEGRGPTKGNISYQFAIFLIRLAACLFRYERRT